MSVGGEGCVCLIVLDCMLTGKNDRPETLYAMNEFNNHLSPALLRCLVWHKMRR